MVVATVSENSKMHTAVMTVTAGRGHVVEWMRYKAPPLNIAIPHWPDHFADHL